jgi:cytochrome b
LGAVAEAPGRDRWHKKQEQDQGFMKDGDLSNAETALADVSDLRVWDLPVRLMHWGLVIVLGVCWWSGVSNELQYHLYSGYAALWIILMRVYWGLVGSDTARFVNFVRGPGKVLEYARKLHLREASHSHGHNPLGAISVVLLLGLTLVVVCLGLFAVDVDGLYSGPMSVYVTFKEGRHLARLHYRWFTYLEWLVVLHLVAVGFYLAYKRENLIRAMITGKRRGVAGGPQMQHVSWWRFLLGAVIVSIIVYGVSTSFYF